MITDRHILYMLREAKARAKQKEYKIPQEEYPNFQTDSRDLDYTTIYIISKYAEAIICDNKEELDACENDLKVASQYFDAATNIVREFDHSIDYLLLGACAYYLSEDFGSAKALLLQLSVDTLGSYRLLTYLIISTSLSKRHYRIELNEFEEIIYSDFLKYLDGGEGYEFVLTNILKYRKSIIKSNDIFAVLYIDILHAVIKKTIQNSSWELIPLYSHIAFELWRPYLSQPKSTKILWSAQKLIGENGIFAGNSGIIQLPTGVGKTKSIELIIRSAFLSGRTNTVLIIAPLRALCGEIKSDLQFAFGNEANINHFSDVLQDDFNLLFEDDKNNIIISTPEKIEYIIYHQKDLLDRVGLYIFDEGHMFDSRSRGASYELLVTTVKRSIDWTKQIVFISAVLSNAYEISKWLLGEEATIVSSDRIKTTEKNIGFVSLQEADSSIDYYADFDFSARSFWVQNVIKSQQLLTRTGRLSVKSYPEKNAKDISIYLMELLDSNGAVAIYVNQPNYIKSYIDRVIELKRKGVEFNNLHNSFNLLESEKIQNLMRLHYGDNCTFCNGAVLGIFPHYSDLQEGVKLSIEFAIRNQLIKNVICTSTLAQGVNLPIKYLLITAFDGFQNKMKARDLQNLIGRTARSGIYTEGSIIVTDIDLYKDRNVKKGGGLYKWNNKIKLFDKNNSEPCKSSILSLVEDLDFGYDGQRVKIGPLVLDSIQKQDTHYKQLEKQLIDVWVSYAIKFNFNLWDINLGVSAITDRINTINKVSDSIESYITFLVKNIDDAGGSINEQIISVCKDTFAYYLCTEEDRKLLIEIFTALLNNVIDGVSKLPINYNHKAMIGINDMLKIVKWIDAREDIFLQNDMTLFYDAILELFYDLNEGIKKYSFDTVKSIFNGWVFSEPISVIYENVKDGLTKGSNIINLEKICRSIFGYDMSFLMGNIIDLVGESNAELTAQFKQFQKQIKYGLNDDKAICVYELGFADRIVAKEIAAILNEQVINDMNVCIRKHKKEIKELLSKYPTYFTHELELISE